MGRQGGAAQLHRWDGEHEAREAQGVTVTAEGGQHDADAVVACLQALLCIPTKDVAAVQHDVTSALYKKLLRDEVRSLRSGLLLPCVRGHWVLP